MGERVVGGIIFLVFYTGVTVWYFFGEIFAGGVVYCAGVISYVLLFSRCIEGRGPCGLSAVFFRGGLGVLYVGNLFY